MTLVTTDDLAVMLKRDLTDAEEDGAALVIALMTAELEEICNRPLEPRVITGELVTVGFSGQAFLKVSPVISVSGVTYSDPPGAPYTGSYALTAGVLTFSPTTIPFDVLVDYSGGLSPPQNAGLRSLLLGRLTRIMAKVHDDALGVGSLTQEGYNAAYLAEGWTEQELAIAQRRRRRVVRTGN